MASKQKILIVDDDEHISELISLYLIREGYDTKEVHDGKSALEAFKTYSPNLIMLDIMMPVMDGYEVCKEIRKTSTVPIIMLTAKGDTIDKVLGLELGADDYVTKPFPMSVFQKKLAALLSRIAKQSEEDKYNDGTFAIDFKEMTASLAGKALGFTPLEYRLLKIFTKNPQNVLTRQMLLERLWDIDENFVDEHALTVAVSRVRNKIETNGQQYIKTVYGMGYMWVGGVQK